MGGLDRESTVWEEMRSVFRPLLETQERMHQLEEAMQSGDMAGAEEYHRLQTWFENNGGYQIDVKIRTVLNGMGFTQETYSRIISGFSGGEKTRLAIARLLLEEPNLLILDEPTAVLTPQETDKLFQIMRNMKADGKSLIIITHKLHEVLDVSDRVAVLRKGEYIGDVATKDADQQSLTDMMVGHSVSLNIDRPDPVNVTPRLVLDGLTVFDELGVKRLDNVSFTVNAGEVLGVTGLLGDGRSELFQAVFGDLPYTGQLFVEGRPVKVTSTPQAIRLGIGYVPRNRKENGIIKDMDIVENGSMVTLPRLARRGLIDQRRRDAEFDRQVGELHIKMGKKTDLITSLSGGNQQKVVLAKWLSAHPKVLILDNPTQGVDVGAKEEIYDIILRLAREGVAVVVLSSEAQEIIRVCDRALVLYHGALQGEVSGADMNEQTIMHLATGGAAPSAQAIHTEE